MEEIRFGELRKRQGGIFNGGQTCYRQVISVGDKHYALDVSYALTWIEALAFSCDEQGNIKNYLEMWSDCTPTTKVTEEVFEKFRNIFVDFLKNAKCNECGKAINSGILKTNDCGDVICEKCFSENYFTCPQCGTIDSRENAVYDHNIDKYICTECADYNEERED